MMWMLMDKVNECGGLTPQSTDVNVLCCWVHVMSAERRAEFPWVDVTTATPTTLHDNEGKYAELWERPQNLCGRNNKLNDVMNEGSQLPRSIPLKRTGCNPIHVQAGSRRQTIS